MQTESKLPDEYNAFLPNLKPRKHKNEDLRRRVNSTLHLIQAIARLYGMYLFLKGARDANCFKQVVVNLLAPPVHAKIRDLKEACFLIFSCSRFQ